MPVVKNKFKKETMMSSKSSWRSLKQDQLNDLIRKKAYELYEKRGYSSGNDQADWFEAERIVKFSR